MIYATEDYVTLQGNPVSTNPASGGGGTFTNKIYANDGLDITGAAQSGVNTVGVNAVYAIIDARRLYQEAAGDSGASVDWGSNYLKKVTFPGGTEAVSVDWYTGHLIDPAGTDETVDWVGKTLEAGGAPTIDWGTGDMKNGLGGVTTANWINRQLFQTWTTTVVPTNGSDLVNKTYADSLGGGGNPVDSDRLSTNNIYMHTYSVVFSNGPQCWAAQTLSGAGQMHYIFHTNSVITNIFNLTP